MPAFHQLGAALERTVSKERDRASRMAWRLALRAYLVAPVLVEDGFEEPRWRERASRLR